MSKFSTQLYLSDLNDTQQDEIKNDINNSDNNDLKQILKNDGEIAVGEYYKQTEYELV